MLVALAWVRSDARRDPPQGPAGRPRRRRRARGLQRAASPAAAARDKKADQPAAEADVRIALIQLGYGDAEPVADAHRAGRRPGARAARATTWSCCPSCGRPAGFDYRAWGERAEPVDGPTGQAMAAAARDAGVMLHAGSIVERPPDGETRPGGQGPVEHLAGLRPRTASLLATYRKIHRFGFGPGEPPLMEAGEDSSLVDLPDGAGGTVRVGLSTCYDLRFPELYRAPARRRRDGVRRPRRVADGAGARTGPCWPAPGPSRTSASSSPATPRAPTRARDGRPLQVVSATGEALAMAGTERAGAQC